MGVPTKLEHAAEMSEAERKLDRLRLAPEEAKRAIRDAEAMIKESERRHT
jgi:hypothetical protein